VTKGESVARFKEPRNLGLSRGEFGWIELPDPKDRQPGAPSVRAGSTILYCIEARTGRHKSVAPLALSRIAIGLLALTGGAISGPRACEIKIERVRKHFTLRQMLAIPLKISEHSRRFSLRSQWLRLQHLSLVDPGPSRHVVTAEAQSSPLIENVFRN